MLQYVLQNVLQYVLQCALQYVLQYMCCSVLSDLVIRPLSALRFFRERLVKSLDRLV